MPTTDEGKVGPSNLPARPQIDELCESPTSCVEGVTLVSASQVHRDKLNGCGQIMASNKSTPVLVGPCALCFEGSGKISGHCGRHTKRPARPLNFASCTERGQAPKHRATAQTELCPIGSSQPNKDLPAPPNKTVPRSQNDAVALLDLAVDAVPSCPHCGHVSAPAAFACELCEHPNPNPNGRGKSNPNARFSVASDKGSAAPSLDTHSEQPPEAPRQRDPLSLVDK